MAGSARDTLAFVASLTLLGLVLTERFGELLPAAAAFAAAWAVVAAADRGPQAK
jgi:hypothetical protein